MFADLPEHQASKPAVKNSVKIIAINLLLISFLNP